MSSLCKTCDNRNTEQCGSTTCLVSLQRTQRAITRHQQRLEQATNTGNSDKARRHQEAIRRLQHQLDNKQKGLVKPVQASV